MSQPAIPTFWSPMLYRLSYETRLEKDVGNLDSLHLSMPRITSMACCALQNCMSTGYLTKKLEKHVSIQHFNLHSRVDSLLSWLYNLWCSAQHFTVPVTSALTPCRRSGLIFFLRPLQDGGYLRFSFSWTAYYVFGFKKQTCLFGFSNRSQFMFRQIFGYSASRGFSSFCPLCFAVRRLSFALTVSSEPT